MSASPDCGLLFCPEAPAPPRLSGVVLDYYRLKATAAARGLVPRERVESDADALRVLAAFYLAQVLLAWRLWALVARRLPRLASLVSLLLCAALVGAAWLAFLVVTTF